MAVQWLVWHVQIGISPTPAPTPTQHKHSSIKSWTHSFEGYSSRILMIRVLRHGFKLFILPSSYWVRPIKLTLNEGSWVQGSQVSMYLRVSVLLIAAVLHWLLPIKISFWFKKYRKSWSDIYYNIDFFAIFHWDFKPWHHSLHFWRYIYSWDHSMLFFMMAKIIYIVTWFKNKVTEGRKWEKVLTFVLNLLSFLLVYSLD